MRLFDWKYIIVASMASNLAGCAMQAPYAAPVVPAPSTWSAHSALAPGPTLTIDRWWTALNDPALNVFVDAGLKDSPTLAQAAARIEEASAFLGVSRSARLPLINATAGASRAREQDAIGATATADSTRSNGSMALGLSWEVDLFGRVRNSVEVAERKLDARSADADGARLTLISQIAESVLGLRACEFQRTVLETDADSREKTLALTRRRVATGVSPPSDESRSLSGLAQVRTDAASQAESCAQGVNQLVALTGLDASIVREQMLAPLGDRPTKGKPAYAQMVMPTAPQISLAIPAIVLAAHPSVVSAERELAAAYAGIAVSKAERLPRLDISALLSGQWLHAAGTTANFTAWSLGAGLSGTLFDGGSGAAAVGASAARYRAAEAMLRGAVRSAMHDIENALAATASAEVRIATTRIGEAAADRTLAATEARWRVGAVSLFELEDARRLYATSQSSAISAEKDRTRAWVQLVRASGNTASIPVLIRNDHVLLSATP